MLRVLAITLVLAAGLMGLAIPASPQPWVDDAWEYRVRITVNSDSIEGNVAFTDFPVLATLNGTAHATIFSHARPDGSDLLFTSSDGITVLQREIVSYEFATQESEIWFRSDVLSKSNNEFFLYYGNPDTTQQDLPPGAWSVDYRVVYHFAEDPGAGILTDSSPQSAHAILNPLRNWTSSDVTDAQIHQGWFFNGSSHHIRSNAISTQGDSYVISAWLLHADRSVDFMIQANPGFWHLSSQGNGLVNRPNYARSGADIQWHPNPIPLNGYHHFAWVFDGVADTLQFYFDGNPQPVFSTFPANLQPLYTGQLINPSRLEPVGVLGPMFFNSEDLMTGGGDEFRIREGTLSAEWIKTEYRNQRNPGAFLAFGPEEVVTSVDFVSSSVVLYQNIPNPFDGGTSIRFNTTSPGRVLLAVYDVAGREVARLQSGHLNSGTHERYWDGRLGQGHRAALGVYFLRLETVDSFESVKMLLVR